MRRRRILINAETREIIEYVTSDSSDDLEEKLGKDYVLGQRYNGTLCYIIKPRPYENYFFQIGEDKFGGKGVLTGWPTGCGLSSCEISMESLKRDVQFLKFFFHRKIE